MAARKHTRARRIRITDKQPERARAGPPDVYATTHTAGLESLERTAAAAARADRGISCSAERAAARGRRVKGRRNARRRAWRRWWERHKPVEPKNWLSAAKARRVSLSAYYYYYKTSGGGATHGSQRRRATKTRGPRAHHRAVSSWEPMSPPAGVRTTDVHSARRGGGAT